MERTVVVRASHDLTINVHVSDEEVETMSSEDTEAYIISKAKKMYESGRCEASFIPTPEWDWETAEVEER